MDGPVICLKGLQGQYEGRSWQTVDRLKVGRMNKCEVYLDDTSVSRVHAEIFETRRGWVLRDLGSTNGTFLNGERLGRMEVPVREGDILQFGEICLAVGCIKLGGQPAVDGRNEWRVIPGASGNLDDALRRLGGAQGQETATAEQFASYMHIGRAVHSARTLTGYLEGVLWELAEAFAAPKAVLMLVDERTGALEVQAALDVENSSSPPAWIEPWVGQEACAQARSLLLRNLGASFEGRLLHSLLCGLLRARGRVVGVFYVARGPAQEPFEHEDLLRADALALSIAPSVDAYHLQFRRQEDLFIQTLTTLTELVNLRANASEGHAQRVTDYALLLADELNLSPADRDHLRLGAPLHDLGTLGVRDEILHKPGPLTHEEMREVRAQFLKGAALLESLPSLVPLIPIVRNHREHWNGSGYPDGLAGPQIPLLGRVVGLADAFDAMTTDRPYRRALPLNEALAEIGRLSGSQFDPTCVAAFLRLLPQLQELFHQRQLSTHTLSRATLETVRASLGLGKGKASACRTGVAQ